jgi:hypothetical protein
MAYAISPNTNIDKIWNLSSNKNIVLCIKKLKDNKIKRSIIPINNNFLNTNPNPIPTTFIRDVIPEIFQILSIENFYEDSLLKDLLTYVQAKQIMFTICLRPPGVVPDNE